MIEQYDKISIWFNKVGYVTIIIPTLYDIIVKKILPYLYISPNQALWCSTYYWGPDNSQKYLSKIRRSVLGHNFNPYRRYKILTRINNIKIPE